MAELATIRWDSLGTSVPFPFASHSPVAGSPSGPGLVKLGDPPYCHVCISTGDTGALSPKAMAGRNGRFIAMKAAGNLMPHGWAGVLNSCPPFKAV